MATRLVSWVFATHLGTLIAIPGLVLAMGACFVVLGQKSLGDSIAASTGGRTLDLSDGFARSAAEWTACGNRVLAGLAAEVAAHPDAEAADLAAVGEALFRGEADIASAEIVQADGTGWEMTRDGEAIRVARTASAAASADGAGVRWSAAGQPDDRPRRVRGTQAVRDAAGRLLAVGAVHLDLDRIDGRMAALAASIVPARPAERASGDAGAGRAPAPASDGPLALALLCGADGRLVASSAASSAMGPIGTTLAAVAPLLADLARDRDAPPPGAPVHARILRSLAIGGEEYVAGIRPLHGTDAPDWFAVVLVRADRVSAPALGHLRRSLAIGVVVLALAVGLSFLLAEHLARQRRLVDAARAQAASAEERLRSLGSYRLVRRLGEGGMGTVWLAEHELLARPTAVKLILPEALGANAASRERALARFAREAKVTASLRSRNTVTLYDYGLSESGSFYYAMELLDGMDLETLVKRHGAQPAGRVIAILVQACRSLGEAHARGLVHRDIKPANLFLCRLGSEVDVVKVLDFGLVAGSPDDRGAAKEKFVQGTPAFMPPEQARGHAVDARSDLYALGCVAYWLLCDRLPFTDVNPQDLMLAHIQRPPPPLDGHVPAALAALVLALLEKEPSRRPVDAAAVQERLQAIAAGLRPTWSEAEAVAWWKAQPAEMTMTIGASAEAAAPSRLLLRTGIGGITVEHASAG